MDNLHCLVFTLLLYIFYPRHFSKDVEILSPYLHPLTSYILLYTDSLYILFLVSVEDALAHPYLTSLHDISDEPVCMTPFSFDFEQHALTEEQMKELIYREGLAFNPEYQHM